MTRDTNGGSPAAGIDEAIDAIVEPLREQAAGLRARREQLMAEVGEIDAALRKLERIERAAHPELPRKAAKGRGHKQTSAATDAAVLDAVRKHAAGGDAFTADELAAWAGITRSTANAALKTLRESEFVRLAGRAPVPEGHRGLTPYVYRLFDGQAD